MKVKHAFTVDLKPFSSYPAEEEELVSPGVCFTVDRVEKHNNKHLIYLELKQQHRRTDQHQVGNKPPRPLDIDKLSRTYDFNIDDDFNIDNGDNFLARARIIDNHYDRNINHDLDNDRDRKIGNIFFRDDHYRAGRAEDWK